ncbi:hypothetical protein ACQEVZ_38615 [Dactylosporangium sp. CA-152071]|uniref:hypothetical protein n=1 Tax=Dactylosporangium sp. CA-152071 TaxID=3239933 RepID=UPI003D910D6E
MTAPQPHPAWCDQEHGEMPLHSGQVGADLDLTGDLAYAVYLQQKPGEPAEVHLMRHTAEETSFTRFTILEASILRDLLGEGLGLLAREAGLR